MGALEGQYYKKTGKSVSFSTQNLVDCDKRCDGCSGGEMEDAYQYIKEEGIYLEEDYPYQGKNKPCVANQSSPFLKISSYVHVLKNDENYLQKAVATVGPISVGIDATDEFQFYESGNSFPYIWQFLHFIVVTGIYRDQTCQNDEDSLNHAVLVVGYGTEKGEDYWIIKNSWGNDWGENGFGRMSRNYNNLCGLATEINYPIL